MRCSIDVTLEDELHLTSGNREVLRGYDAAGTWWAIKPDICPRSRQLLFSELVVGGLAAALGLHWGTVRRARLQIASETPLLSADAVAIRWIDGLTEPLPPSASSSDEEDKDFIEALFHDDGRYDRFIAENIGPHLDKHDNLQQLAGFALFSAWADGSDFKPDVLQLTPEGRFLFLDGEHYLGNRVGEAIGPMNASHSRWFALERYPFCSVLVGRPVAVFEPWAARLRRLRPDYLALLGQVPKNWLPTDEQLQHIEQVLFGDIDGFLQGYLSVLEEAAGAARD